MGGRVKNEGTRKTPKTIDIFSLCLESKCKLCHMCACSPFQVTRHIWKFVNWLNS